MDSTFRETPHQKGVYVTEQYFTTFRPFTYTCDVIKYPFDLGAGKIGISHQTCALANFFVEAFRFQCVANRNSQSALPDNSIENRLACVLVPDDCCFALIEQLPTDWTRSLLDHARPGQVMDKSAGILVVRKLQSSLRD